MKTIRAVLIFLTIMLLLHPLGWAAQTSSIECTDLELTHVTVCDVNVSGHHRYTAMRLDDDGSSSIRTISVEERTRLMKAETAAAQAETQRLHKLNAELDKQIAEGQARMKAMVCKGADLSVKWIADYCK
jgi:hypothetical protein